MSANLLRHSRPHSALRSRALPAVGRLARALVVTGVLCSPLAALLWATGAALAQGHADWLLLALPTGRRLGLLLRSLALCTGVAALDMTLGVLVVCAGWRRRWPPDTRWAPGARLALGARLAPLVLLALPPYLHALTWSEVLRRLGVRLTGPWAGGWVQAMALLPVGVGLAMVSLETVDRPLVDVARTYQPDFAVFRRVALPLSAPLLAAGAGVIFLLSLMDYSLPSLFGVNTYALEIFAEFSASYQPARALLLAAPLLAILAALLYAGRALLRRAAQESAWRLAPWSSPPRWPPAFALAQQFAVAVWGAQIVLPLLVLTGLTVSGGSWLATLAAAAPEFGVSCVVAGAAALLSLLLSWLALGLLTGERSRWAWAGWLCLVPAALPAPLVGVGLIALWNRPGLAGLYASLWLPVLAAATRFTPYAILALLAQYRRIDPLLWDAARVHQGRPWQTFWRVRLPLLLPGALTGTSLVFALALGELGATLLVAPPGQSTLALRIYNYLHYGASDTVAGLCLALLLVTLTAGFLGAVALRPTALWPTSAWPRSARPGGRRAPER